MGDLVLYVNSHMLMIDKSQARNSYEYIQALRDTLSTASVPSLFGPSPRAIRYANETTPCPSPVDCLARASLTPGRLQRAVR